TAGSLIQEGYVGRGGFRKAAYVSFGPSPPRRRLPHPRRSKISAAHGSSAIVQKTLFLPRSPGGGSRKAGAQPCILATRAVVTRRFRQRRYLSVTQPTPVDAP